MKQGQTRSTIKGSGKTQNLIKGSTKTRGKRTDLIHAREMVFSKSPLLLKEFIALNAHYSNDDLDVPLDAEELQPDETPDQETELEVRDEDEISEEGSDEESTTLDYSTLFNDSTFFKDSAALSTNAIYAITVTPVNGRYHCWFEGPSCFESSLPPEIRVYINKLQDFLNAIAQWLESEKQAFLSAPNAENFMIGEADFAEVPVILQKGFLQRINKEIVTKFPYATKEEFQKAVQQGIEDSQWLVWPELDETQFSRLLDKIWLLWPEWNMPLANIFSPAYHLPWMVEVGSKYYREAGGQWLSPKLNNPDFGDKDMSVIKKREFLALTPEAKLHILRAHFKGGIALAGSALKKICERLAAEQQGGMHDS
ncbi:MAG: hypothetical protein ABIJ50_13965 [Pseudomonadota bacterium]